MRLIVGLGNPGPQYILNRHNVGYLVLDFLSQEFGFSTAVRKDQALLAEGTIAGQKVLTLKPLTFMNLSGQAVASIASFYKIPLEDILVIHDDLDMDFGKIRVKINGGAGGHNGLRSIDQSMGKDYWRLKIGIGHPGDRAQVTPYVLGNFTQSEQEGLIPILSGIGEAFPHLIEKKPEIFMNQVSQAKS